MADGPNVLWMVADDHRFDALGCAGDPTVRTPTLDALADDGVHFTRAYMMGGNSGAVCVPARACLHTGRNVFAACLGSQGRRPENAIPADVPVAGELLRSAGYATYGVGKWHNGRDSFARSFGGGANIFFGGMSDHSRVPIHDYAPDGRYPDAAPRVADGFSSEVFADAAIDFLRRRRGPEPFLLYVAFTAPHDPRMAPSPYREMYDPDAVQLPPNFLPQHPFDNGELHVRDENLAPFPRTPEVVRRHIADYYAMITHLDHHIGRILAALREQGLQRDTVVAYTADHGLAVGQHGLLGKQNLYDHSVRVPLLLSGPGLPAGRRVDGLCYSFDVLPTLAELAGVPAPPDMEARSLLPLAAGRGAPRDAVCSVYRHLQRMVTDGRYKLIRYYGPTERVQLFDLATDPWERVDLSADPAHGDRLRGLQERLARWQVDVGDPLGRV